MSAIFGENPNIARRRLGLPLKGYYCLNCKVKRTKGLKHPFCSQKCSSEYHRPLIECTYCHTLFRREASDLYQNRTGFFCSKHCFGKWIAQHYGFGAFPEHSGSTKGKTKWDYDMVWLKHLETGLGAGRLSGILNIPKGTISYILWLKRRQEQEK